MDPTAEDLQVKGRDHVGSEVQLSVTDTPFSPVHKASDDRVSPASLCYGHCRATIDSKHPPH